MANSDKNIVITPNIGSATDNPKVVFSGADSSTAAQDITLYAYPTDNGTISFEGSAGQLFSITNDLTGTIFSVNDVSGIPSIEVDDDGTIRLAEFGGNVLIGTAVDNGTDILQINGSVNVTGTVTSASGAAVDEQIVNINSPVASSGTWTAGDTDDWGTPRIGNIAARYNDGTGYLQYNVPAGMDTAYISQLTWSSGGYVDVLGIQSDGGAVFLRRINTRQAVENANEGAGIGNPNQHDGSTITLAATGLSTYSAIRLQNRSGRFHLTGMSFTSARLQGAEGTGMVHPAQISNIGAGSGLDADLLDGQQGSYYAAASSLSSYLPLTGGGLTGDLTVNGTITNQNDAITKARMMGWVPAYSNSTESTVKWDTAQAAVALGPVGSGGMAYKAIKMKAGQTVRIAMQMKGSTADTDGVYIRVYHYAGDLPDGKTHVSHSAGYTLVQEDSTGDTAWKENSDITTSYVGYERTYTAPADGYMSIVVLNWAGYGGILYCKQPDIQFEPPTGGATISDKSDNVNYNVIFTSETSGSQTLAGIDTGTFTFNPSTGTLKAPEVQATSDETLKTNIVTIPAPLEKLEVIRGVNFNWKENNRYAMGVIAQEVEKVIPEAVGIDENGIRSVNYASLVGLLIEAVKTLSDRIDDLEGK